LRALDAQGKAGYLTVLIVEESRLRAVLKLPEPIPMEKTSLLIQADSDWFLGNWNLQAGDRA
jgi:hypothetical protein